MKPTKGNQFLYIRHQLATDPAWALRALVKIYERQTASEKSTQGTIEQNGIGFSGIDGNFFSSLAEQYNRKGTLSEKQMVIVMKRMKKYARQILDLSIAADGGVKLRKQVIAWENKPTI